MKLQDICELFTDGDWIESKDQSDKGIRLVQTGNIGIGKYLKKEGREKYISQETFEKLNCTEIYPGDILISRLPEPVGRGCIIPETNERMITAVDCTICRIKDNLIDKKYFCYYLQSPFYHNQLFKSVTGTTRKRISRKNLGDVEINIPDRARQLEIVRILDNVMMIIDSRKQQLQQFDELVKARFVEMFGECENVVRLGDCCEVHARIGWQALTRDEHMKTGDYMLVTGTDFKDGEINYSTCVYVAKERYEMDKHIILKNNDVLITKDGTIGKVAIVHNLQKPATLNAGIFVVRPDERFNKEYIANVFKGHLFSDFVEASKTGATIKHLNQKHLVEFMIPVPSLEEQETFAQFIKQVDKSKFYIQTYYKFLYKITTQSR